MKAAPRISVVTTSYNHGEYLRETLESVRNQQYPNLEHIVMDGGSTDNSIDTIRSYASQLAYWISGPDGGPTNALIKGFSRATGDILCWLNSDDLFEPGCLAEVAEFFASRPGAEVVYGDATLIDKLGRSIKPKKEHAFSRFIWLNDYNFIPQPSTFWTKRLYDHVGGLDPAYRLAYDADLWARFSEVTTLHHIPRRWSRMRIYPEQRNQSLRQISDAEDERIRSRYLPAQPHALRMAKWLAAKSARVCWKTATGCYRD